MSEQSRGRPRLALLHAHDWREVRRGTERLLEDLAGGLAGDGYATTVIAAHRGRRQTERRGEVSVVLNRRLPSFGPFRRHSLAHVPGALRTLRHGNFDLAHAFHPADGLAAVSWSRRTGAPSVLTVPAFPPAEGSLRLRVLTRVFDGAAAVVVPTAAVGDAVTAAFPAARTVKIPPGVDTARFFPGGERAADPAVFCPADISEPRKRVGTLVQALANLRSRLPSVRLVLANPYPGRDLPSWTRGPGVEVREIAGDADLIEAYRSAWVTALPARDEPFGLVLAESMACGTPVIGAADGGIPEVVGEGPQGTLVDGEGEAAWAEALAGALAEPPAEEAAQAARRRGEEFSVRRCVGSYEDLYARLLERG